MNFALNYNLTPADRIVAPLAETGITKHHAIYLGFNEFGQELIAENNIKQGVRVITARQFELEHPVISRIEKFCGTDSERQVAINVAISLTGANYDLFLYNCEHYANQIQYGKAESKQIQNFLFFAGLLTLGCLMNNNN